MLGKFTVKWLAGIVTLIDHCFVANGEMPAFILVAIFSAGLQRISHLILMLLVPKLLFLKAAQPSAPGIPRIIDLSLFQAPTVPSQSS